MKKAKPYMLLTPGPTEVPDFLLKEMTKPLIYHREASFEKLYQNVVTELKKLFVTKNQVFVFSSSGTGAMEAAVTNFVNRTERVLVVSCGKFGERWRELLFRYGVQVRTLSAPYGQAVKPEELERQLKSDDALHVVYTTLTETSTGVLQDIKAFGEICHKLNRRLIVDCIAGLGADPFYMDDWYVDVAVGATQKALGVPPGLSFIAVSDLAWERVQNVRTPRYYFDLRIAKNFATKNQTPWTPAISLYYPLLLALQKINKKGIEHFWKHHQTIAEFVRKSVKELGLEIFSETPSNALTVIKMPENLPSHKLINYIKVHYRILFANGQQELKDKILRIGHMGYLTKKDIAKALQSLKIGYHKLTSE
ncbi:MAG: alanine--glyoxylate aminotransferase family protein [candidate division WOR-3 bacterium]|nr:alanine--glyoxylate aminotransferase family protein [candidate division WOR-3 bacterium]